MRIGFSNSVFFFGPRNENFLVFVGVFGWKESERGKKIFIFIYFYYLKFFYLKYDVAFFLNTSIYYILLFIIFLSRNLFKCANNAHRLPYMYFPLVS